MRRPPRRHRRSAGREPPCRRERRRAPPCRRSTRAAYADAKQRCTLATIVVFAAHVQVGLVLSGKRSARQILGGRRRSHRDARAVQRASGPQGWRGARGRLRPAAAPAPRARASRWPFSRAATAANASVVTTTPSGIWKPLAASVARRDALAPARRTSHAAGSLSRNTIMIVLLVCVCLLCAPVLACKKRVDCPDDAIGRLDGRSIEIAAHRLAHARRTRARRSDRTVAAGRPRRGLDNARR